MKIAPKNWKEFQHYKDRNPTWIKLHKKLLDDFEFQRLPLASRALAPMLWLIASEHEDGVFDADPELIAFRIRVSTEDVKEAIGPLIGKGFFKVVQFDSAVLAEPERVATPETYKPETEKALSAAPTAPKKKPDEPEETPGFVAFWEAWPRSDRKIDRLKCFDLWRRGSLEAKVDQIVAHVTLMRSSRKWRDGFEPSPQRYLRGKQWLDPIPQGGEPSRALVN